MNAHRGTDMKNYIDRTMSYDEYLSLIDTLLADGKTTGALQSDEKTAFTRLNRQRMQRLGKTLELDGRALAAARSVDRPMIWLTISEAWCGDGAQNLPVFEKFAAENDNIQTRYILRDENLELMDQFLTDGARSIPKLIILDAADLTVLCTWGPRPVATKEYFEEMKANGTDKALRSENLQRWYNADKGHAAMSELASLIEALPAGRSKAAGS
jgi:hypothetical protein